MVTQMDCPMEMRLANYWAMRWETHLVIQLGCHWESHWVCCWVQSWELLWVPGWDWSLGCH